MALNQNTLLLDEGWEIMQRGIDRLQNVLEEHPVVEFSAHEYMMFHTTIYRMCTQNPPHDYSWQLYDKFRGVFVEYITSTVLPSLKNKQGEFMLRELLKRWQNHKVMLHWLSRFFYFLDRHCVPFMHRPTLNEVGLTCFRDLVFVEMNGKVRDAVKSLIDQERDGRQIDRALLKNVEDIFVELGMGQQMDDFKRKTMEDSFMNLEVKANGSGEMSVERRA